MIQQARWKKIPGYPRYEVSDRGGVRSLRYNGRGVVRLLKPAPMPSGHLRVTLYGRDGEKRYAFVNWLVLEAFVGPRPDGMWSCHNDDNPTNNCLGNLRWDTPASNAADRVASGMQIRGESVPSAVLTAAKVERIVKLVEGGLSRRKAARMFRVGISTVCKIMRGETWVHVTGFAKASAQRSR